MNVEDLYYQDIANERNIEIINEYEKKSNSKDEKGLKALKTKKEELIKRDKSVKKLIEIYNNVLTKQNNNSNIYSKYKIEDFEQLLQELKEEQLEEDSEQIKRDIKKVLNIIDFYNKIQDKIIENEKVEEKDFSTYLENYKDYVSKAYEVGLPEQLILDLMRNTLDKNLSEEDNKVLKEVMNKNLEELRKSKDLITDKQENKIISEENELPYENKDIENFKIVVAFKFTKDDLIELIKQYSFEKEKLEKKVQAIDLNGNHNDLVRYINISKKIDIMNEKLSSKLQYEIKRNNSTKFKEANFESYKKIKEEIDIKSKEKDNKALEDKVYNLKKQWKKRSMFKKAFNNNKKPNWSLITDLLTKNISKGGMHL